MEKSRISGQKEPIQGYSGSWDNYVEWLSIEDAMTLEPPNDPYDDDLLTRLKQSMQRDGWVGPPLLMQIFDDGEYLLLQGSHRLAAAASVRLTRVPFLIIRGGEFGENSPFETAYLRAKRVDAELALAVSEISDENHHS